jgi:hypothetical protein
MLLVHMYIHCRLYMLKLTNWSMFMFSQINLPIAR